MLAALELQGHLLSLKNVQLLPRGAEFGGHGLGDPHLPLGQVVCFTVNQMLHHLE